MTHRCVTVITLFRCAVVTIIIVAAVSRGPMEHILQFITLIEFTCTRTNEVVGEGTGSNGRWWAVLIPSVLTLLK